MGNIFKLAQCVFLWLGKAQGLASLIESLKKNPVPLTSDSRMDLQDSSVQKYILENEYWRRAWVTQEIVLARSLILFCDGELITYSSLLASLPYHFEPQWRRSLMSEFGSNSIVVYGKPLVHLLWKFRGKQCIVPQDRVFSLMSLCREEDQFDVDCSLDKVDIMYLVLSNHGPRVCFCDIALLARTLDFSDVVASEEQLPETFPYVEFDIYPSHLALDRSPSRVMFDFGFSSPRGALGMHIACSRHKCGLSWQNIQNQNGETVIRLEGGFAVLDVPPWEQWGLPGGMFQKIESTTKSRKREVTVLRVRIPLIFWARGVTEMPDSKCGLRGANSGRNEGFSFLVRIGYITDDK
jgi:hypothetical protein